MSTLSPFSRFAILGVLTLTATSLANATTVTVNAADVIYAAGTQSSLLAGIPGGLAPVSISVSGLSSLTFSVSGTITVNQGTGSNMNDADGVGAASPASSGIPVGSISGIFLPGAGDLVGVFVGAGGPSGPAPASLNFVGNSSFTSLSPLLDQTFFIGDGLTGDGIGSVQTFLVPVGATQLYLGISDACGYNGGPSCYLDNIGSYTVTEPHVESVAPVPEPSSFLLLGTGGFSLIAAAAMRRRLTSATPLNRA